jgi:hypothetical protein
MLFMLGVEHCKFMLGVQRAVLRSQHKLAMLFLIPAVIAFYLAQGCGKIKGPSFTDYASPRVVVRTPASPAEGNVPITFVIMDRERDNASVLLEYSVDNGLNWLPATLANTAEAQDLETSHYPGVKHNVKWNSLADAVGCSGNQSVIVKVLPSDAQNPIGTSDIYSNNQYPLESIYQ